jgi:hypothetical protein
VLTACALLRCSEVEYLNSRDATIMGSRNGHAPIYMWYTLTLKGYEGMRRDVEKCLRNAHLLQVCTIVVSCLCMIIALHVADAFRWR